MKISASIQAANQLSLLNDIQDNSKKFDYIHVDSPEISVVNYCEFSNGIKETVLNHKDARKFPIIIHQSYFSGNIRPFCDMDFLENSI